MRVRKRLQSGGKERSIVLVEPPGGLSDFPGGGVTDKPVECSRERAIALVVLWRA